MLIACGLEENYNFKNTLFSLWQLIKFWKWQNGKASSKVEKWFCESLGVRCSKTYDSARSGLYCLLRALNLKAGDEVLVQAFTCAAAINPIIWNQLKPVFVDIDLNSLNISVSDLIEKISPKTKVIIVQHTFGYPADLDAILKIAKQKNLIVIEDCAHTIGGKHKEKNLGTIGDAGVFSFGSDKAISSVSGGCVVTNNKDLFNKLESQKLNELPSNIIFKKLLHPIIEWKHRTFYGFFGFGRLVHFLANKLGLIMRSNTLEEKKFAKKPFFIPSKFPNSLAELALMELKHVGKLNLHRKVLQKLYDKEIYLSLFEKIRYKKSDDYFLLRYPLLLHREVVRGVLFDTFKDKQVILGDWYDQVVGPKDVDLNTVGYNKGMCPNAEEASERIINLPLHSGISENTVEKKFWLI